MKNYRITVNGTAYDVAVEELGAGAVAAAPAVAAPVAAAPVAAPAPAASGAAGSITVASPMPGKILAIKANAGQAVVMILEAMKMENEITAPEDGTIASINVAVGDSVESGDTLATLN